MFVDDLRLRTKVMIPVAIMASVVLVMVAIGTINLSDASCEANNIENRQVAVTQMVRASRLMTQVPYSILGSLVFDANSAEGMAAVNGFASSVDAANHLIDNVAKLVPDKAPAVRTFKNRFVALVEQARRPMRIGIDTPGLSDGSKLKAADLDKMAEGARLTGTIDTQMRNLIDDFVRFNNQMTVENVDAAAKLGTSSRKAVIFMIALGLISTAFATGFSLWMSASKISGPLTRLVERMGDLERGDLTATVEGQDRGDEVGVMARAVQVFKRQLTTDHLTGAANRAHFFDIAERQSAWCQREKGLTAMVLLDIDNFKQVNDVYGHALGDEVLKAVSAACRSTVRSRDTLARLGGEEFVVLMPATDLRQACEVAERLRLKIASLKVAAQHRTIGVTASFGCSVLGGLQLDVAAVLAQADAALYAAKQHGRNRVASAPTEYVAA